VSWHRLELWDAMKHAWYAAAAVLLLPAAVVSRAQSPDGVQHTIGWVTRPDARLEYLDFGNAPRTTIVLVPGYGDNAHVYDDLAPILARRYHVVALTPRGQGASSTPGSRYTVRAFSDDLQALLDTLHIQRTVLVGHSAGGATITDFATRHPDRVNGLIYLDAAGDLAGRDSVLAANPVRRPEPTDSTPEGARRWYRETFFGFWSEGLENSFRSHGTDSLARNRPRLLPQFLADYERNPADYRHVRAPALIIAAVKTVDASYPWLRGAGHEAERARAQQYLDRVLNPWYAAGAARAHREIRGSRIVSLPGHHYIFVTAQRRVADEILRFLSEGGREPGSRRQPATVR
jgi:pimeloyl-ACP methyl ester carboxylesterase